MGVILSVASIPINLCQFSDERGESNHAVIHALGFQASSFDNLVWEKGM